jgi:hypothetical protein
MIVPRRADRPRSFSMTNNFCALATFAAAGAYEICDFWEKKAAVDRRVKST